MATSKGTAPAPAAKVTAPARAPGVSVVAAAQARNAAANAAKGVVSKSTNKGYLAAAANVAKQNNSVYKTNPLTSSVSKKDVYGDVGNNRATGNGAKFDASKKVSYENNFDKFGKEAELLQAKDPKFLTRRNDFLATDIIGKGDTSEKAIRNYLSQNAGFTGADAYKQEHTIQAIAGRIGEIQGKDNANQVKGDRDTFLAEQAKAVGGDYDSAKALLGDEAYSSYGQAFYKMNPADQELYKANIQEQLAGLKDIQGYDAKKTMEENAIGSKFSQGYEEVKQNSLTINNLAMEGKSTEQIAAIIGKPVDYVNSIVNGDVSKFTSLSSEEQADLLKYNSANKENLDLEKNKALEASRLALQRAQEDYQKAYADQTQNNDIMEKNMSVLARITGVGYSSLGLEGMGIVHQKGLDALTELTKNMDRYSQDVQTKMTDIVDSFNYNTKVLNMQADDAVKQSKNGFFNTMQQVRAKYGELSSKTMEQMRIAATDFTKQVYAANQWRVEQQNKQADTLYQRMKDAQELEIQKFNAGLPSSYDPASTNTTQTQANVVQYEPRDNAEVISAAQDILANPKYTVGKSGGQCGAFVNEYLHTMGIKDNIFVDPISDKTAQINSTTPTQGSVAVFDYSNNPNASNAQKQYGHVAIVTKVNADGTVNLKESNKGGEGKIFERKNVDPSKIKGFFDPRLPAAQTTTQSTSNVQEKIATDDNYSLANQIASGNGSLSKVPAKQYKKVVNALGEIVQEKVNSTDDKQLKAIYESAKYDKEVSDTTSVKLTDAFTVLTQVADLTTQLEDMEKDVGPIEGLLRGKNPYDVNAQTLKTRLNSLVPKVARGVFGEVGVLTDQDIERYMKTLPNGKMPKDVSKIVGDLLKITVTKSIINTITTQAKSKRNVNGYAEDYENAKDYLLSKGISPNPRDTYKSGDTQQAPASGGGRRKK